MKKAAHCKAVYNRASVLMGLLRRLFGSFTESTIPLILNTYIHPTMEYAVQAWAPWMATDNNLLQRIYQRATKL
ncbi:hypothetical protein, partial [Acinetobacter baumannii]|uniref:hypothetical protein n=1 Tax=Acinetobacter baumannii TaxID=470 RepID=UPI00339B4DD0